MRKLRKKSQSEIMGLAIIVILVVIGFTFMIKFMAQSKPKDYKLSYSSSQMTSNFIQTVLKTTVAITDSTDNCIGMDYGELILSCSSPPPLDCKTKSSCEEVEDGITDILLNTVGDNLLKHEYYFSIKRPTESSPFIAIGTECPGSKASSPFTLPSSSGTIDIRLDICKD